MRIVPKDHNERFDKEFAELIERTKRKIDDALRVHKERPTPSPTAPGVGEDAP